MNDAVRCVNSKCDYWGFKQKFLCFEHYTCIKCNSQWNDTSKTNRNQKYNIWIQNYSTDYLSRVNELFTTKSCPNCEHLIFKNGGCNYMMCEICKHEFCWSCLQIFDTHIHSDSIKCDRKMLQNNQLIFPLICAIIMKLYFAAPLVIYTSMIILNYLLIFAIGNIMLACAIVEVVFIKILSNFERDFREILKDNTDVVTRILAILSIIYPFCYFIACYVLWQNFYFRSAFIILLAELFCITLLYIIYLCVGKKQKTYIYIFAENIFYNMI